MNNSPLVSIIVPSYNHGAYIEKCIDSIFLQTYKNIEVIVIDDQSTDNSLVLLQKLKLKYQFTLIEQNHSGLIKNLNLGISKYAKGKYVGFCSSDDYFSEDRIEKMVKCLEKNPEFAACSSNYYVINSQNQIIGESKLGSFTYSFSDIFRNGKNLPANSLINKEILINTGIYDINYALEDLYLWLKLTKIGYKLCLLEDNLFYYRMHDNNTIKKHSFLIKETEKILQIYSKEIEYKNALLQHYYNGFINILNFSIIDKKAGYYFLSKIKFKYFTRNKFWISLVILLLPESFTRYIYNNLIKTIKK